MVNRKTRKKPKEEEEFSNYPEEQHDTCEHRWSIIKVLSFFEDITAIFICDKCGQLKRIKGKD